MNNMKKEITYISDSDFKKLSKKQKLQLPEFEILDEIEITNLVLIRMNKKLNGYSTGSFFAYTEYKGWWRPMTHDCWSIVSEIDNPAKIRCTILRGDFENDGINIFTFVDEFHKAYISYGGTITIKRINN